jgi:hypothetical protein
VKKLASTLASRGHRHAVAAAALAVLVLVGGLSLLAGPALVSAQQATAATHAPKPTHTPKPKHKSTPTPAPTWHTMGTWSGNTQQTPPTVPVLGDVRFDWSCSVTPPNPAVSDFQYGFANLNAGGIVPCDVVPTGSQLIPNNTGASSTVVTMYQDGPMGDWTVTIEEFY